MMTSDDSLRYFSFFDLTALQGVLCLNPAHLKYSKEQTLTQNTQNTLEYSKDPILTAFELSWELRQLAFSEFEFKSEYLVRTSSIFSLSSSSLGQSRPTAGKA